MFEKFRCTNTRVTKDGTEKRCNWFLMSITDAGVSVTCPNCKAKHLIFFDKGKNKLASVLYDGHLILPIKEKENGPSSSHYDSGSVKLE